MPEKRTAGFLPGLGVSITGDSEDPTLNVLPEYLLSASKGGDRYLVRVMAPAFVAYIERADGSGAELEIVHWFDATPDDAAAVERLLAEAQKALRSFFAKGDDA